MRLNLGCGNTRIFDMLNIDIKKTLTTDLICDVRHLPFADNSCEVIYSSHCIEHIYYAQTFDLLKEWYRVLAPGGVLRIYTPDFGNLIWDYVLSHDNIIMRTLSFSGLQFLWWRVKYAAQFWLSLRLCRLTPGLIGVIMGDKNESPHRALFTYKYLKGLLANAGFTKIRKLHKKDLWYTMDASGRSISLGVECIKQGIGYHS